MLKTETRRFLYNAQGVGVAGTFTSPPGSFDAQASSALAITGGTASSQSLNFKYGSILSFDLAETQISGKPTTTPGDYSTLISVTIQGLNVQNVLTADTIVMRMAVHSYLDGEQASIITVGSHIDNLMVAGQPVQLTLDADVMANWDTYAKAETGLAARVPPVYPQSGVLGTSIFSNVKAGSGVTVTGNRIDFPEFGSIYLGEIFITPAQRRLTMMRLALGCDTEGDTTIGCGAGNGTCYP